MNAVHEFTIDVNDKVWQPTGSTSFGLDNSWRRTTYGVRPPAGQRRPSQRCRRRASDGAGGGTRPAQSGSPAVRGVCGARHDGVEVAKLTRSTAAMDGIACDPFVWWGMYKVWVGGVGE
jgi:hypothetical protein